MSQHILPQEFQLMTHRSYVSVRTQVSKSRLDDGELLKSHIKRLGLGLGDHVTVQVVDEHGAALLHEAEFIVTGVRQHRQVVEDGNTQRTVKKVEYTIARMGAWWDAPGVPEATIETPEFAPRPQYATDDNWNVEHEGFGRWRVRDGAGEKVATGLDKETAVAVARGDSPVPEKVA